MNENKKRISTKQAYKTMLTEYPDALNVKQLCKILGTSRYTVYKLFEDSKFEYVILRIGVCCKRVTNPNNPSALRRGGASVVSYIYPIKNLATLQLYITTMIIILLNHNEINPNILSS